MYSGTLLIRRLMGVSKVSIFQGLKNCSSVVWGGGHQSEVHRDNVPLHPYFSHTGTYDALVVCVGLICNVMLENPPRGPFIPYKPHSLPNQAYQPRTTVSLFVGIRKPRFFILFFLQPNATAGPYTASESFCRFCRAHMCVWRVCVSVCVW